MNACQIMKKKDFLQRNWTSPVSNLHITSSGTTLTIWHSHNVLGSECVRGGWGMCHGCRQLCCLSLLSLTLFSPVQLVSGRNLDFNLLHVPHVRYTENLKMWKVVCQRVYNENRILVEKYKTNLTNILFCPTLPICKTISKLPPTSSYHGELTLLWM